MRRRGSGKRSLRSLDFVRREVFALRLTPGDVVAVFIKIHVIVFVFYEHCRVDVLLIGRHQKLNFILSFEFLKSVKMQFNRGLKQTYS
jgi:hypothetical protein